MQNRFHILDWLSTSFIKSGPTTPLAPFTRHIHRNTHLNLPTDVPTILAQQVPSASRARSKAKRPQAIDRGTADPQTPGDCQARPKTIKSPELRK